MAAKTVLNYLPRESVIHKMTGTTKLAFFLLFTFASMITYNTWVLLGLLVVSLLAFRLSRIKFREVRFMMTFMLVFLLLNNLFIFLFDPNQGTTLYGTRTVLCHLFWRYDLTAEQLFYMVNISLKYFVALPVAILFITFPFLLCFLLYQIPHFLFCLTFVFLLVKIKFTSSIKIIISCKFKNCMKKIRGDK